MTAAPSMCMLAPLEARSLPLAQSACMDRDLDPLQVAAHGTGKHLGSAVAWSFRWRTGDGAFYEEVGGACGCIPPWES